MVIESGRQLILVKHSLPEILPDAPASQWRLGEEGRARCQALAEQIAPYQPNTVVTSVELKAAETGQLIAALLGQPYQTAENLHEHQRDNEAFESSQRHFQEKVAAFFNNPNRLVYGRETADQSHQRFFQAVTRIIDNTAGGNIAIVAHGTVISLLAARANQLEPFPLWQSLGLPSFIVTTSTFRLLKVVTGIKSVL